MKLLSIFLSKGTVFYVFPNLDTYFFKALRTISLFTTTKWQEHPFQQEILDLLWLILYGYFKPNLFSHFLTVHPLRAFLRGKN